MAKRDDFYVGEEITIDDDNLEQHEVVVLEVDEDRRKLYVEYEDATCDWVGFIDVVMED